MIMITHWQKIRLALACVTLAVTLPLLSTYPVLAQSISVLSLQGKVENVGSGRDNGKLQLSGKVRGAGALNLSTAELHVISFLSERRGAVELVSAAGGSPLLPLRLSARKGSKPTAAIFETPAGVYPKVRAELKQRDPRKDE